MPKLNEILNAGETCLKMLGENKYDDAQEQIAGYTRKLNEYLGSVDVTALDAGQQEMLGRINDIHRTVMELIEEHKGGIHMQLDQLNRGRKLENMYNVR